MTGVSNYSADYMLNWLSGSLAMPAAPSVYLAMFTGVGTDAGSGFTEVTGGSYARVQVAGSVATSATTSTSSATLTFTSVPSWIVAGMQVLDATTPSAITGAQTVLSTTPTTVVLSANVNATVGSGDTIRFSAFGAASGTAPSVITNSAAITFAQATASWGTVLAFGLYDALSSGNLLAWDFLGSYNWLPCTVSSASPGVITAHAHGYTVSSNVVFSTEYGGTAPTYSQSTMASYAILVPANVTTDTFTVTNGGTAVNTSSTGDGMIRAVLEQLIPINATTNFPASSLNVSLA